jgi:hypothetical protein
MEAWQATREVAINRSFEYMGPYIPQRCSGHVEFEILSKEFPAKARGIQFSVNDATAYENPEEYFAYAAMLKSLKDQRIAVPNVYGAPCNVRMIYAGGLNHDDIADVVATWEETRGHQQVLYDEMDGANWDATMQQGTVEAELRVYEMLGMRAHEGARIAAGAINSKLCVPHNAVLARSIRYVTRWKRLSGKWNTTVGNVTVAMEIRFWTLRHLPKHLCPVEVECLMLGDDFLAAYWFDSLVDPNELASAINDLDKKCGITPERGIFSSILDVSFISMGFWRTHDGGLAAVPHPARQLKKLFWTIRGAETEKRRHLIASGIAEGFWPIYKGFRLMENFLRPHYTIKGAWETDLPGYAWWRENFTLRFRGVDWSTGVEYKYGIPLKALPTELPRSLTDTAYVMSHPLVDHMSAIEGLDPADRARCVGKAA